MTSRSHQRHGRNRGTDGRRCADQASATAGAGCGRPPPQACMGMQTALRLGTSSIEEEATVTTKDRHRYLQVQTGTARAVRSAIRVMPKYLPSILRGALLAKNTCASGTVWQPSRWGRDFPSASSYTGP